MRDYVVDNKISRHPNVDAVEVGYVGGQDCGVGQDGVDVDRVVG